MRKIVNFVVTCLKGEKYEFDKNLPLSYLFIFIFKKVICLIWGMLRFRSLRPVYVSPSATIKCPGKIKLGKNLNVGERCYVDALSVDGLELGDNVSLGFMTTLRISGSFKQIGTGVKIGNNVGLGTHGYYGCGVGSLTIGNNCIFGNYVSIHPENHNYIDLSIPIRLQGVNSVGGVSIGDNCWIGTKATILDGTKIGNGCIVAAGAVVKGEFPDNVIIGGLPAKIIKHR